MAPRLEAPHDGPAPPKARTSRGGSESLSYLNLRTRGHNACSKSNAPGIFIAPHWLTVAMQATVRLRGNREPLDWILAQRSVVALRHPLFVGQFSPFRSSA